MKIYIFTYHAFKSKPWIMKNGDCGMYGIITTINYR